MVADKSIVVKSPGTNCTGFFKKLNLVIPVGEASSELMLILLLTVDFRCNDENTPGSLKVICTNDTKMASAQEFVRVNEPAGMV
jgi:hypothetical protein